MQVRSIISSIRLTAHKAYEVIIELPQNNPTHYRIKDDKGEVKTFNMNLFVKGSANDEN